MAIDVHEALAALHRVGVGEVAHQDERLQLLAGAFELLWPSPTIASTAARATASLSATTMMPLLMSDGGRLKVAIGTSASCASGDERGLGVAVVGGQDDAVAALGDAVLDLLELPVGILAAVELDDFDAGGL